MKIFKPESIVLTLIVLISAFFHFLNLSYPAAPVFDEAHFSTYSAKFASREAHFDIHPPLGKFLYSLVLDSFPKERYENKIFLETAKDPFTKRLENREISGAYENFPYLALRGLNAFFGIFLAPAAYFFLKSLSGKIPVALIFAAVIAFENALLLETRLILLNGMFLFFGFLALAFYFHPSKNKPILAGLIWGLALAVKFIALGFAGAVIADLIFSEKKARAGKIKKAAFFIFAGLSAFIFVFIFLNNAIVPVEKRLTLYESLLNDIKKTDGAAFSEFPAFTRGILPYVKATAIEFNVMLSGYTSGVGPHPLGSNWYSWPVMYQPIVYFSDSLLLLGNPFLWAMSTAAVVIFIVRFAKGSLKKIQENRTGFVLLGGYIFTLLLYAVLVRRVTFLYHYFPAYLFALAMLSTLFWEELEKLTARRQLITFSIFFILVTIGFFVISPYTFGV